VNKTKSPIRELTFAKRMVVLASAIFLLLLLWQSFSASSIHRNYQESLMDSVTDRILSDYQEYLVQLRLEIDLFQQRENSAIRQLHQSGENAKSDAYMALLKSLKANIKYSRLFAFIDEQGHSSLTHITGDFLPACKEEVASTVAEKAQEHLFLHHSKTSVHFDLLQPLHISGIQDQYLFVAFNTNVLKELLVKYQLPHQELFLMRTDSVGKIELSSEKNNTQYKEMIMTLDEVNHFSFVKKIPNTRWQLAIRLDEEYSRNIYIKGLIKAFIIWLLLTMLIYSFYRMQKYRAVKQSAMRAQLQFKDQHDKLTSLTNRNHFEQHLKLNIEKSLNNNDIHYGVAYLIDIDQFQVINNSYGYAVGDKILYNLSLALKEFLPKETLLSRLGNDEFAILLPTLLHGSVKSYAHKLRQFIQQLDLAEIEKESHITASIGAVILDGSQQDAEQVLSSLSLSVVLAKKKGRNRIQVYQSDDSQLLQHAQEMDAVHHLADALKHNRLVLYRQQILPLSQNNTIKHFEVLVRMKSEQNEIIPPGAFIPAAEKYGLIKQLDRHIITLTLQALTQNSDDYDTYSINLSGATLADRDTFSFVKDLFEQYDVCPNRICFEITETSAISHLKSALKFIEQATELGCMFSLDDFGSGLSSYSYLQQLPVSIIKIDGVFVKDIDTNQVNRIFVENIQRTAIAMNKRTVAEFVESQEIQQILCDIGVNYGQGYHIHKPEPWYNNQ